MIKRGANDGLHIVIEGIDGSGKSTVIRACRQWAEQRGVDFFDGVGFSEENHRPAEIDDIEKYFGLLLAEPTFSWVGKSIREEIIAKRENEELPRYSGLETAHAFALDRLVQFRKTVIPFLQGKPNKIIFQDRSLASSLAYQPLQDDSLNTELLMSLPGNQQTIEFYPSMLILIRTEAAAAMSRLAKRTEKQDKHIFEVQDFQERLVTRFLSDDVLGPFRRAGTIIGEIDGNQEIPEVSAAVDSLL